MGEEIALTSEIPMNLAMSGPDSSEWLHAMAEEIKSILKNDTWQHTDRPNDQQIIDCLMILCNKFKADGTLERRKARLVAQGFSHQPGVHCNQTFAPVARLSSIRLLITLAAQFKMNIGQFDITCAYLNGEIEKEILMEPPKSLIEILRKIIDTEGSSTSVTKKAAEILNQLLVGNKVYLLFKRVVIYLVIFMIFIFL